MRSLVFILSSATLLLSACGGTETGNAEVAAIVRDTEVRVTAADDGGTYFGYLSVRDEVIDLQAWAAEDPSLGASSGLDYGRALQGVFSLAATASSESDEGVLLEAHPEASPGAHTIERFTNPDTEKASIETFSLLLRLAGTEDEPVYEVGGTTAGAGADLSLEGRARVLCPEGMAARELATGAGSKALLACTTPTSSGGKDAECADGDLCPTPP